MVNSVNMANRYVSCAETNEKPQSKANKLSLCNELISDAKTKTAKNYYDMLSQPCYSLFSVDGKVSGKTHVRTDELTSYREFICEANTKRLEAIKDGNIELAQYYSSEIDKAQAQINTIINQEDAHANRTADVVSNGFKQVADTTIKVADTTTRLGMFS